MSAEPNSALIIWFIIKWMIVILVFLYFVFSLIVIKQVSLMSDALITEVDPTLRLLSIINSLVALGLVAYSIVFI
ncbi:hypothetical protein A2631_05320 [Candidatus Daviesbacteria bacterium RIFCSPHIGHO2_01_FULL_44_29]|uniref:Uncharacterized protein n=1 Tax=Candidatus Daviesbacteria bacterium RIFCSPHIGHO2_02_FULL_43_12 TaxID=1797776 RepID=A0A1F5KGS5_9BACT|nr:MAG: hypothetical protein A2631_05320 [Candidatus Daviesbacteria bacterium RIFCSPHIGHO2_01_FULL_44_29]OGE40137.1 MAG: hypothetical protein A3D25_05040 [Candidatus Daviesbacteria bacterium RIFCSPHIGHO2_02_FULL_43_12]OGE70181.1 MAG: hypothetical protein A3B55_00520 [Candidatus Daviesbacteria bacterium RIFCSPLOWO2_01_FULL_43_15]